MKRLGGSLCGGAFRGQGRRASQMIAVSVAIALVAQPAMSQQMQNSGNTPNGSPLDQQTSASNNTGATNPNTSSTTSAISGLEPIQPVTISGSSSGTSTTSEIDRQLQRQVMAQGGSDLLDVQNPRLKPPAAPGEYESWLQSVTGLTLKRFGSDLLLPANRDYAVPATATIPPDYALNIGDVVSISLIGSIQGSANFEINRNGEIDMPHVGKVRLAGVRYRDLKDRIMAAVGRQYRSFEATVSIKQLRGVRVYVTGFANNPGAYTVNSLSTLVNAVLAAGGPSAGGSFRSVKLYRNGNEVVDFDLYDLIRKGDKSRDPVLQNEDVLFIPPAGRQVAVIGSVNEAAIYEARPNESVEDVLRLAGGPTNLADSSRIVLYRLGDLDTTWNRELTRDDAAQRAIEAGDIVQVLPYGSLRRPQERQSTLVRIDGEVNRPGNYYVKPGTTMDEAVAIAGGLTGRAYIFGTNLARVSVRLQQRESFNEAVHQLELSLAAAPLTLDQDATLGRERQAAAQDVLGKLRAAQPDGRVVLPLAGDSTALPADLTLENNDAIYVPPRPSTVGVFGAVYRPASFLLGDRPKKVRDYLAEAGGPIRAADKGQIFLVRANGSVISKQRDALSKTVLPGDVIFVPVKARGSQFWQRVRDISGLIFGAGLSTAAIVSITK